MMIAILSNMLAINRDARSALGSSSRLTILLQELSCFVFRIFISLSLKEKNAIRDPDTINDMTRKKSIRITRIVVACALMNKRSPGCPLADEMLKG
jgi:hypothetical protein